MGKLKGLSCHPAPPTTHTEIHAGKLPPRDYITGKDRNEDNAAVHYYDGTFSDPGNPLCARGWNRNGGFGYSIFRNTYHATCKICIRRARKNLSGVEPRERKTKWI